jgi:hypothetical protein
MRQFLNYFKSFIFIVTLLLLMFVLAPTLISAASDLAVLGGIVVTFVSGYGLWYEVLKLYRKYRK